MKKLERNRALSARRWINAFKSAFFVKDGQGQSR
jgi:hypothetical protein